MICASRQTSRMGGRGEREMRNGLWLENLKVRAQLDDLSVDGRIILKYIFKKHNVSA